MLYIFLFVLVVLMVAVLGYVRATHDRLARMEADLKGSPLFETWKKRRVEAVEHDLPDKL